MLLEAKKIEAIERLRKSKALSDSELLEFINDNIERGEITQEKVQYVIDELETK